MNRGSASCHRPKQSPRQLHNRRIGDGQIGCRVVHHPAPIITHLIEDRQIRTEARKDECVVGRNDRRDVLRHLQRECRRHAVTADPDNRATAVRTTHHDCTGRDADRRIVDRCRDIRRGKDVSIGVGSVDLELQRVA